MSIVTTVVGGARKVVTIITPRIPMIAGIIGSVAVAKENVKDIRDYVVFDVIIPSIRKSIFDTVIGMEDQILESVSNRRYNDNRFIPYEQYYQDYTSMTIEDTLYREFLENFPNFEPMIDSYYLNDRDSIMIHTKQGTELIFKKTESGISLVMD